MARIEDIARETRVSSATVSRYLRKEQAELVSTETGRSIYETAIRLGYKSIPASQSPEEFLIVHKEHHFLDHIDNGYFFAIRSGIEEEVSRLGAICRFVPVGRLEEEQRRYAGVLVVGNYTPETLGRILSVTGSKSPVFVGKLNFVPECYDTVTYDVEECVRLALHRLLDSGLHDVLFIDGKDRYMIPTHCLKISHVRNFMSSHPEMHLADYLEMESGFGSEAGYQAVKEYLARGKRLPEAIFTATDPLGIGVTKACNEMGLRVGEDVSIVSLNGDNSGQWISPALTTVDFHSKLMGVEAVRIAKAIENEPHHVPKCVFFKPELVEGKSIRPIQG